MEAGQTGAEAVRQAGRQAEDEAVAEAGSRHRIGMDKQTR